MSVVPIELKDSVQKVVLQFNFLKSGFLPPGMKELERDTESKREERKKFSGGSLAILQKNCSLTGFPEELEKAGYGLAGAFCQERSGEINRYYVVRFTFIRSASEIFYPIPEKEHDISRTQLHTICTTALWEVRMFSNPFYRNGKAVTGQSSVNINLGKRLPLFCRNGEPAVAWETGEDGKDVQLPIKPSHHLRLDNSIIDLVTAE